MGLTPSVSSAAQAASWIPITNLVVQLRSHVLGDMPFGYRKLLALAQDGAIVPPLEQRNGRWGCPRDRLPDLARKLGLSVEAAEPRHAALIAA